MRISSCSPVTSGGVVGVFCDANASVIDLEIYTRESMRKVTLNVAECDALILILKKARHLAQSTYKDLYEHQR